MPIRPPSHSIQREPFPAPRRDRARPHHQLPLAAACIALATTACAPPSSPYSQGFYSAYYGQTRFYQPPPVYATPQQPFPGPVTQPPQQQQQGVQQPPQQAPTTPIPPMQTRVYGTPVPGKPGFVTSPYAPDAGYVDVRGFAPGTEVKDPYSDRIFLVP